MLDKKAFQAQQPVAYQTLSNALKTGRLSHAYLFYGPKNPIKNQAALLMAQSLSCAHPDADGFACQQCESCRQIEREESPDFFWLHPGGLRRTKPMSRKELDAWWKNQLEAREDKKAWRIRKEDILAVQDAFAASAITEGSRQSYILEGYESATPSASNALLKFLEEPKAGLCGILTADELANVLPTIVSRCQLVPFRGRSKEALAMELGTLIEDEELVAILASAGYDVKKTGSLMEDEALFDLRDAAKDYWQNRQKHSALVALQLGPFSKKKHLSREALEFFFHALLYYLQQEQILDALHLDLRIILLDGLDALRLPLDPALLLERVCFQIKSRSSRR